MYLACSLLCGALAAEAESGRGQSFSNWGDLLQWIIEWVKPSTIDAFTDQRFQSVKDHVRNIQRWSGERGVLLEVPIATAASDSNYRIMIGDGLLVIGPGKDIIDAAVKAMDTPTLRPGIPEGFELSLDETYFVWAEVEDNDSVIFSPQIPESTHSTVAKIQAARAQFLAKTGGQRITKLTLLNNMLRHYQRTTSDIDQRRNNERLQEDLAKLTMRLENNERTLRSELDRARKLASAAATIDGVAKVLGAAASIAYAASTLDAVDSAHIRSSQSVPEAKEKMKQSLTVTLQNAGDLRETITRDGGDFRIKYHEVIQIFEHNGAPIELKIRLLEPVQYGQGPEYEMPKNEPPG
jgi:hypothetical protein